MHISLENRHIQKDINMFKHFTKILIFSLLSFIPIMTSAKVYLVSVGISDYPGDKNDLRLPVNDARTITKIYVKNTDSRCTAELLNEKATKKRIIAAIKQVYRKAGKDDAVVFYFSGHGSNNRSGLQAYDGELTYANIREAMAQSQCPNKTMIIDACYAGNLRSNNSNAEQKDDESQKANVMLFLSSRGNETSREVSTWKNGIFTKYLQEGLRGYADKNKDRIITAKEIFDYVYPNVVKITNKLQHPVMWGHFKDDMPVMIWKKKNQ